MAYDQQLRELASLPQFCIRIGSTAQPDDDHDADDPRTLNLGKTRRYPRHVVKARIRKFRQARSISVQIASGRQEDEFDPGGEYDSETETELRYQILHGLISNASQLNYLSIVPRVKTGDDERRFCPEILVITANIESESIEHLTVGLYGSNEVHKLDLKGFRNLKTLQLDSSTRHPVVTNVPHVHTLELRSFVNTEEERSESRLDATLIDAFPSLSELRLWGWQHVRGIVTDQSSLTRLQIGDCGPDVLSAFDREGVEIILD